jgi:two-component system sensor histidine kinase KdpD
MLDNLVDNAFKYGGQQLPVEVTAAREGDRLLLSVLDRGPGVPAAWRERVFDVFERVDQPGDATPGVDGVARRGAGLGLAVCRVIAQVHGGGLTLQERTGGGSCLVCWLPLNPQPFDGSGSGWELP